jgi:carbonic anhydrase
MKFLAFIAAVAFAQNRQSPIDLVTEDSEKHSRDRISFHFKGAQAFAVNTSKTMRVQWDGDDSHLSHGSKRYVLEHFEARSPSEHTINGNAFAFELQFTFTNRKDETAMLAVLFRRANEANENEFFNQAFRKMDTLTKDKKDYKIPHLSAAEINELDQTSNIFHYIGSLTTDPDTENVKWYVLETPLKMSREQYRFWSSYFEPNARAIQKRNGRVIALYS